MITTTFKINSLTRTLDIHVFDRHVFIVKADRPLNSIRKYFETRNFCCTKTYPTIEGNIKRGMRYFKADNEAIAKAICKYKGNLNYGKV